MQSGRRANGKIAAAATAVACALLAAAAAIGSRIAPAAVPADSAATNAPAASARVTRLVRQMTLAEKLRLLRGTVEPAASSQIQAGYLAGVARLGIPSLRMSDGPPGVITRQDSVGMTQTLGVAASFDPDLARDNGVVIGRDARALGIDVVLEPFVNLERDPTWARAFNLFGEDPLLTGVMGAQTIRGIQSQGVMAQVKHYVLYEGANDVSADDQTLHELYLTPFTAAVGAGVSSIMCSYNRIGGVYSCGDAHTLQQILRGELGFRGFVTSDWGATHALDFLTAGLDMEMGGTAMTGTTSASNRAGAPNGEYRTDGCAHNPASTGADGTIVREHGPFFCADALGQALARGTLSMGRIDQAVANILGQYERFGLLDGRQKHSVTPLPVAMDEQVIERTAEEAAVLLQNRAAPGPGGSHTPLLPLSAADLDSLALVGPGAAQTMATYGAGEKPGGLARQQVGAYQLLHAAHPRSHIVWAVADDMTGTPIAAAALRDLHRTDADGRVQAEPVIDHTVAAGSALAVGSSATWRGTLQVPQSGAYWISVATLGAGAILTLDGREVANTQCGPFPRCSPRYGVVHATELPPLPTRDGLASSRTRLLLDAGAHALQLRVEADASGRPVQVRLAWVTPPQQQADRLAAIEAARRAHTAVVFAWSDGGITQPLPDDQDRLIADIVAVNPRTVVVLNASLPVPIPWLSQVPAVLQMWFPGDAGGRAAVALLTGRSNPAGRLPLTWPQDASQLLTRDPSHPERSSSGVGPDGRPCAAAESDCRTTYSEGLDIGYRWFDAQHLAPLFPFGYGLSYTRFGYADLQARRAVDGGLDIAFTLRNTGMQDGDEVAQVYLGAPAQPPAGVQFAPRSLVAFQRVHLRRGQSEQVTLHVAARELSYWSSPQQRYRIAAGTRTLYVGASSRDLRLQTALAINP